MNQEIYTLLPVLLLGAGVVLAAGGSARNILSFSLKSIDGMETALSQFQGKVLLLVNTASKCGFTPQYKILEEIYQRYKEEGLVILGFPANNFLGQEPGTNPEIKNFCMINYGVSFPMFAKISVRGKDIHPLFKFLVEKETNPKFAGKITWNFTKFLVDRRGNVVARFHPKQVPDDPAVIAAIEKALQEH
ncbi:MAG TPA: glutathione peroxidase [Patescibacteria group bacterium]|nr:glutathione peroxidase [Patescibacteria group bacterium]